MRFSYKTSYQDDKFPAVFGGIILDHFHPESDPEKNQINPVNPVYKKYISSTLHQLKRSEIETTTGTGKRTNSSGG
jgi:hypothetical protein